jgi:hypothetical protein
MKNNIRYNDEDFIHYYLRDSESHPKVAICLFKAPDNKIYRGISLCSPSDNFVKSKGREIAKGRAIKAFVNGVDSEPIVADSFSYYGYFSYFEPYFLEMFDWDFYKSCFASNLTGYEKYLVEKKWQVEQS